MVVNQISPKVSVIILTYNRSQNDVVECVNSVKALNYPDFEVILVDNSTSAPSRFSIFENVQLVDVTGKENLGASRGRNLGIKHSSGEYIFFVDDDVVLHKNCLSELIATAENDPSIGLIGPLMYLYDHPTEIWFYNTAFLKAPQDGVVDVRMIVGGAMLVKKDALKVIGGFDSLYFFYAEDWDYSYRAQMAGYRTVCALHASSWHKVSGSEITKLFTPNRAYYLHRSFFVFAGRHKSTLNGVMRFLLKQLLYYGPGSVPSYFIVTSLKQKKYPALKAYFHGIMDGIVILVKLTSADATAQ